MKKITLVVFDMAGTVVNENNIVYKSLLNAINNKGYGLSLPFVLNHGAGKEKHRAIKDILSLVGDENELDHSEEIYKDFKLLLKEAYEKLEVTSYGGVEGFIESLRKVGIKIALNTGYDKHTAQLLLDKMNWTKNVHYDVLVTADDVAKGRPFPDMILKAMEMVGVKEPSRVLKAGDSIIDIEEGKNAQCGITVGVTTGAHTREQLNTANPTYILDSLTELKEIILVKKP